MDFTISKQIYAFSHRPDVSFRPPFNQTPSKTFVNPGIGSTFNLFTHYIPLHSTDPFQIKKQVDPIDLPLTEPGQSGTGNDDDGNLNESVQNNFVQSKMDPKVYESFQHPNASFIKTDKIFKNLLKRKERKDTTQDSMPKKVKKHISKSEADLKHKFQFH